MDPTTISATLSLVQMVIRYAIARKAGNASSVMAALETGNVAAHLAKADSHVIRAINAASSALGFLAQRELTVKHALDVIKAAEAEGRDITSDEVHNLFDLTQEALDDLEEQIEDAAEVESAPGAPTAAEVEAGAGDVTQPEGGAAAVVPDPNTPAAAEGVATEGAAAESDPAIVTGGEGDPEKPSP